MAAAALLGTQTVAGFVEGGSAVAALDSARAQFLFGSATSFLLAAAVFCVMATRPGPRPFAHAGLALLVVMALSLALAALMSSLLGIESHPVLVVAEWLTLLAALVVGTSAGRLVRRRSRHPAADA